MPATNKCFEIEGRKIGIGQSPYIIAEMSANHNNSYDQACSIIHAAKRSGVDAIKFQVYTEDTITLKSNADDFKITNPDSPWHGRNLYELYKEASTDWDWIASLVEISKKIGLTSFASVFDETAIEFMESLNTPAYKIASFENNHIPLIKLVAKTKKPIIISTGASSIEEIEEAVDAARSSGCNQLALLKCTSEYPADPRHSNLKTISFLRKKFKCEVGLSDHTLGMGVPIASVALGASIIEKHFITNKDDGGVDASFSADEVEMTALTREVKVAHMALGESKLLLSDQEQLSRQFKRSIYAATKISRGDLFTEENIRVVRPHNGLHPRFYSHLLGKQAKKDYSFAEKICDDELIN
jgi:pseudaminic acid synthase